MADFLNEWRTLRIDIAVARTYDKAIAARNQILLSGRVPWIEQLLPTLLFIRAMEVHDDAIVSVLKDRGEVLDPKKDRATLKGRLLYCQKHWNGFNPRLITYADQRNDYGHKVDKHATWNDVDKCIAVVQASLLSMRSIPEPITSVNVEYERVSGAAATGVVWDAKIRVIFPSGVYKQTWRTTETIKVKAAKRQP